MIWVRPHPVFHISVKIRVLPYPVLYTAVMVLVPLHPVLYEAVKVRVSLLPELYVEVMVFVPRCTLSTSNGTSWNNNCLGVSSPCILSSSDVWATPHPVLHVAVMVGYFLTLYFM